MLNQRLLFPGFCIGCGDLLQGVQIDHVDKFLQAGVLFRSGAEECGGAFGVLKYAFKEDCRGVCAWSAFSGKGGTGRVGDLPFKQIRLCFCSDIFVKQ